MTEIARRELANCLEALELVRHDSRLGWEPRMRYRGGSDATEWKIKCLRKHYGL